MGVVADVVGGVAKAATGVVGSLVGGIIGKKKGAAPAEPNKPIIMPLADDAKSRAIKSQEYLRRRQDGRSSTILSDGGSKLGGS